MDSSISGMYMKEEDMRDESREERRVRELSQGVMGMGTVSFVWLV